MRSIGLDIHRDLCEVAIAEGGEVRSPGRIEMTPEALELFAGSLASSDQVALEVSGKAWEVARIIRRHVAKLVVVSPADTGIRAARAKTDRLDARALAKLLAAGSLQSVWVPDDHTRDAPAPSAPPQAAGGAHQGEERDPRRADAKAGVKARGLRSLRQAGPALARVARAARRGAGDRRGLPPAARLLRVGDRGDREADRNRGARIARDPPADDGPRGQRDLRGHLDGGGRRHPPLRRSPQAGRLPGIGPEGAPVGSFRDGTRANLKAGLRVGQTRPGRGELERRQGTGADALLLPRIRARRGGQVAIVATSRKLACLFWCLLTREEDYAYAQPSLTAKKLRRLELAAGAPKREDGTGIWSTNKAMREAEQALARQAEAAYERTVTDWQRQQRRRAGADATTGRAI